MTLKKVAKKKIIAAPMAPVIKMLPVSVADCCGTNNPYAYIRYGKEWMQIVWLPAPTEQNQNNVVAGAWNAYACHNCGRFFSDDTPTRTYHEGQYEALDSMIQALAAKK